MVRIVLKSGDVKGKQATVKVTMHLPEALVEYMDRQRKELSNDFLSWERSTFVGFLISMHKSGKLKAGHTAPLPGPVREEVSEDAYYSDLLKLGGYGGK